MADNDDTLVQVELALANAKRVTREARIVVQTLARLRDSLQPEQEGTRHNERTGNTAEGR